MSSAYQVLDFDLSVARDKQEIPRTRANAVATVNVLRLPVGAIASIHFSNGGNAIPLLNQGMEFEPCPPERDGVYFTNPVGGGTVTLLISYDPGALIAGKES